MTQKEETEVSEAQESDIAELKDYRISQEALIWVNFKAPDPGMCAEVFRNIQDDLVKALPKELHLKWRGVPNTQEVK